MQVQLSRFAERPGLFHQKDLQLIMDILTPANNTALGNGWFPLEIFGAEKFRWVSNAAEVYAAAFRNVKHYLQIYLEPGPSLDFKPFELLVTENDETVARATIKGRQMISIELPATQPMLRKFVLRTEGSDKPAPGEIRVLNYRVFKLIFVQAIVDILPPEMNARPGEGWYPLETFNGETFRWASNDAKIEIADPAELKTCLLYTSFPYERMDLVIMDAEAYASALPAAKEARAAFGPTFRAHMQQPLAVLKPLRTRLALLWIYNAQDTSDSEWIVQGFPFFRAPPGTYFHEDFTELAGLLRGTPILHYDMYDDIMKYELSIGATPLYLPTSQHPNSRGNAFFGDHIAQGLLAAGLGNH